ncbi:GAF and ANTAR domain-containing protein [Vallicoccus soli]|uniref:ANTAR domain-containing protein n=1 Tax=Vallicoccus soli TaxID=2339232 RepID=A0A3A3Z697_9ACTN|nr:GAF and ANTAR domain-containing protein [Vallicoccus soli]RJK96144.1 ANTAR domain-containing protein [Vallicoccus soli]
MAEHDGPDAQQQLLDPQTAFHELSQILLGSPLGEVLERVASLAKRTVPGADEVSVTLLDGEQARSVAFTGDLAVHLDERQYEKGFGPCMDAALSGDTVDIPDTAHEETYPDFARQAARAGVTNTLSVGLPIPQRTVGALNIYGMHGRAFDDDSQALALTFASYAAVALANAALYTSTTELARQMEAAMASRAVIEQAKGMVMARRDCSADEAFALLARASQAANRKLRDIAQEVVAQRAQGL